MAEEGGKCQAAEMGSRGVIGSFGAFLTGESCGRMAAKKECGMINETKLMLWRASAGFLGFALPAVLLGRGIMFALLGVGLITGLLATKGDSLRATAKIMLESWIVLAVVVLMLVLLAAAALGIEPSASLGKWLQLVAVSVCAGGIFLTLREMPGAQLELLLKCLAIGTLAMAGLGVLDAVLDQPRLAEALHGADKATAPYRLNFVSAALSVLLPYVWTRLLIKSREGEPFALRIATPAVVFSIAAVLICGGRAGWVGMAASVLVFVWMIGRWHGFVLHKRHWLLGILTVVGALAVYGFAHGFDFMLHRVTLMNEGGRGMMSGRLDVWEFALKHMLDNPLLGIGLQGFRYLPGAVDMHPHNWLLQVMLETGMIGTLAFGWLLVLMFQRFWRFAHSNLYGVAAFTSMAAFLVTGLANTSIFNAWWLSFFVFSGLLGWRAGWGGADLATRKRMRVVKRRDLVPYGK